jgi:protein tyrosine/serine phosphatase
METIIALPRIANVFALCVCLTLAACGTLTATRPSADVARVDPHPAPINNFQIVDVNGLYRGGQPAEERDWVYLKNIGIRTVIKLNKYSSQTEERDELSSAKEHGIKVIEIPIQPEDWPHNWNLWAAPTNEQVNEAVRALEHRENWPVYIHCSHGKDRTGLIVAIYRVRNNNYCKDTAYNEMNWYGANPFLFGPKHVLYGEDIKENSSCIKENNQ